MHEDMQEHPAEDTTPSTRRTAPLMNVPASGIVKGGSLGQPAKGCGSR
ncbi:hypothetical protein [Arthrobacter citreus]